MDTTKLKLLALIFWSAVLGALLGGSYIMYAVNADIEDAYMRGVHDTLELPIHRLDPRLPDAAIGWWFGGDGTSSHAQLIKEVCSRGAM